MQKVKKSLVRRKESELLVLSEHKTCSEVEADFMKASEASGLAESFKFSEAGKWKKAEAAGLESTSFNALLNGTPEEAEKCKAMMKFWSFLAKLGYVVE